MPRLRVRLLGLPILVGGIISCGGSEPPSRDSNLETVHSLGSCGANQADRLAGPLCAVEFTELVTLRGALDGVAPRDPVQRLADGTFLTGTFQPGRLARWSSEGSLLGLIGNGPGDGPGEFPYALHILDLGTEVGIIGPLPRLDVYSLDGDFLRTRALETVGGFPFVTRFRGGFIGSSGSSPRAPRAIVWDADSSWVFAERTPSIGQSMFAASERAGIWSSELYKYLLRRHDYPSGTVIDSIMPDLPPGFVNGDYTTGNLFDLHVDDRGLIWALISVPDPNAPSAPRPKVETEAEILEQQALYKDAMIQGFTMEGSLVASRRYPRYGDTPRPLVGNLWYRVDDSGLVPNVVVYTSDLVDLN